MAETVLEVDSVDTALAIFGNCDENIRLLEQAFGVTAICRGTEVKLTGGEEDVERARRALDAMLMLRAGGTPLEEQTVRYCISLAGSGDEARVKDLTGDFIAITAKGRPVRPKTLGQAAAAPENVRAFPGGLRAEKGREVVPYLIQQLL